MLPLVRQRYDLVTPERSLPSSPSLSPAQINHEVVNRHSTSPAVDVSELARLLQKASSSSGSPSLPRPPRPRSQLALTSKSPSPSSSTSSSPTLSPLPPPVCTKEKDYTNIKDKNPQQLAPPPPIITVSSNHTTQRPPLHHRATTCSTPTQFIFKKPEYDQHYHETHFHHHPPPPPQPKKTVTAASHSTISTNDAAAAAAAPAAGTPGIGLDRKDLSLTWTDLRRFFVPGTVEQTNNGGKDGITFANQFRKNIGTRYGTWGKKKKKKQIRITF